MLGPCISELKETLQPGGDQLAREILSIDSQVEFQAPLDCESQFDLDLSVRVQTDLSSASRSTPFGLMADLQVTSSIMGC